MMPRQERINEAIQKLEALYEYGGLLGAAQPDKLLMLAVDEIKEARKKSALEAKP